MQPGGPTDDPISPWCAVFACASHCSEVDTEVRSPPRVCFLEGKGALRRGGM